MKSAAMAFRLTALGLLHWDVAIARLTHLAGSLVMAASLAWAIALVVRRREVETAGQPHLTM